MVGSDEVHKHAESGVRCVACDRHAAEQEIAFAFLLSLVPAITLTLFGNMGLL